jgi:hypothetical protein
MHGGGMEGDDDTYSVSSGRDIVGVRLLVGGMSAKKFSCYRKQV